MSYIVAASKPWFRDRPKSKAYQALEIIEISSRDALNLAELERLRPRFVFFPHWSWKVPDEIIERFDCVCFHTAPLPFGRGGSPIQNLILRGIEKAPVNALKMTDLLDAGPIYQAIEISLEGTVTEIFDRIAGVIEKMIISIAENEPTPIPQQGEPVHFERLTPAQNVLPGDADLRGLYDRIRMVDGLDYPKAFIDFGRFRLHFSDAALDDEGLRAHVTIRARED